MKKLIYTVFLGILISMFSCRKENRWDAFKSTGKMSEKEIQVASFDKIAVHNKINVVITQGPSCKVVVHAGKNLLDQIVAKKEGDFLVISNHNRCNWVRSYEYEITVQVQMVDVKQIVQYGTGLISCTDTIHSPDSITIDMKNSGDIDLVFTTWTSHVNNHASVGDIRVAGHAGVSYIFNSGNGFIHAEDLTTDITFLGNHDTGDSFVNAGHILEATINYSGDVFYSGNPAVIKQFGTGSGKLIKAD